MANADITVIYEESDWEDTGFDTESQNIQLFAKEWFEHFKSSA